jgi:hypothetical protein
MTPAEILRKAAAKIVAPGAWTQDEMARDKDGKRCHVRSDDAVCWCAEGALRNVSGADGFYGPTDKDARLAWHTLFDVCGESVVGWNDERGRTAEQVAAKMIEAAELLERTNG